MAQCVHRPFPIDLGRNKFLQEYHRLRCTAKPQVAAAIKRIIIATIVVIFEQSPLEPARTNRFDYYVDAQ